MQYALAVLLAAILVPDEAPMRGVLSIHAAKEPGTFYARKDDGIYRLRNGRFTLIEKLRSGEYLLGTNYLGDPVTAVFGFRVLGSKQPPFNLDLSRSVFAMHRGVLFTQTDDRLRITYTVGRDFQPLDYDNVRNQSVVTSGRVAHAAVLADRSRAIVSFNYAKPYLLLCELDPWQESRIDLPNLPGRVLDLEFLSRDRIALLVGNPAVIGAFPTDLFIYDVAARTFEKKASYRQGLRDKWLANAGQGKVAILTPLTLEVFRDTQQAAKSDRRTLRQQPLRKPET